VVGAERVFERVEAVLPLNKKRRAEPSEKTGSAPNRKTTVTHSTFQGTKKDTLIYKL
jgi:hypothetical protein